MTRDGLGRPAYLNVFKERKTLAPLDYLVESVVGDAAQTGDGIAFGGGAVAAHASFSVMRPCGTGAAPVLLRVLFVAVPQMLNVHYLQQKLRHRRVARMVRVLMVEVMATRACGRWRRRAPLGRIHRPRTAAVSVGRQQHFAAGAGTAAWAANFTANTGRCSRSAGNGVSTLVSAPSASSAILSDGCKHKQNIRF